MMIDFNPAEIPISDPHQALVFCQKLATITPKPGERTRVSIVMPIYNEAETIPILYQRLAAVADQLHIDFDFDFEFVFVDDGSSDLSLTLLHEIACQDERLMVIELSRNFGHQIAISAGIDYACGDGVVLMDADLQDPPEILPQFIQKWQEGYDVVYAIREQRKENWAKQLAYRSFYRLLRRVASIDIPLDSGDFCIMDRRVVAELKRMPERNRFVRGIRSWVGLQQIGIPYAREARFAGKPKYTFTRLLYLALDGLISFSYLPLRTITLLGVAVSFFSLALAVFYAVKKIFFGLSPAGFATIVVSIYFFAGVQLTMLGVIGEYIGRIFEEVKQRPLYIIRQIYKAENAHSDAE